MTDATHPDERRTGPHEEPEVTALDFGFGASYVVLMIALPPLVYYMWICVTHYGGALVLPTSIEKLREIWNHVPGLSITALAVYVGWFGVQALLQAYAPGRVVEGTVLADGSRLEYKMNGWLSFWVTMVAVVLLVVSGVVPATFLYDEFGSLLTAANVFTFALGVYLLGLGRRNRAPRGRNEVYDYFMGTELNPRTRGFDWKLFCEARPGLILWVLINFSMAAKQYEVHGTVTTPMIMVMLFQLFYVADYFWHEEAILSTWDIRHEKFGWMLAWGDLVWVPFTYTLQAQYLVHHGHELPLWAIVGILTINVAGFAIFRGANLQKHRFRQDPERPIWGRRPESIDTARGTKLLVSGWWGRSRHPNYFGDLLLAWSWCLPTGFRHVLPYFYVIYFTWLLVHRERRDDEFCHAKYGPDWDEYRRRVPSRIVPRVY
jgi:Delta14-sterol reductase